MRKHFQSIWKSLEKFPAHKMIRGKKGDISITILVIGVFAICGMALLTFMVSDFKMSNSFSGVGVMENMNAGIDEFLFYRNNGIGFSAAGDFLKESILEENGKKYLYYEKENYALFDSAEGISFSVKYPLA
ncbi:MAG: hypothetical protein PF542_04915 [Nanoarchaeota archaeon]|nr:hypothetical protein [Nanoarchaeota archaeon]